MIFKRFKKVASDVNDAVEFATNTQEAVKEQITESIVKRVFKGIWWVVKGVFKVFAFAGSVVPSEKKVQIATSDDDMYYYYPEYRKS
jgi:hypothetical protein